MFIDFIFPELVASSVGLKEAEARNGTSRGVRTRPQGSDTSRDPGTPSLMWDAP